jgi:hypothetical protein
MFRICCILFAYQRARGTENQISGDTAQGVHASDSGFTQDIQVGQHPSGGIIKIREGMIHHVGNVIRCGRRISAGIYLGHGRDGGAAGGFLAIEAVITGDEAITSFINSQNYIAASIKLDRIGCLGNSRRGTKGARCDAIYVIVNRLPVSSVALDFLVNAPIQVIPPAVGGAVGINPVLRQTICRVKSAGDTAQGVGVRLHFTAGFVTIFIRA